MEVCFHELEHQIEVFIVFSTKNLLELDHVGVVQFLKEDDLSVGALGISRVLEGIEDLLEGEGLSCLAISNLPDDTVGSASDLLDDCISLEHMGFYFL